MVDRTSAKRVIAVGGGKGGVGKSLVTANLAVSLAREGARTVVFDADLGAPNVHTMFGIERPAKTLEDFLDGQCASLEDVVLESGIPRLRLICGTPQAALGAADRGWQAKQKLIRELIRLETDCLIIDVGAGVDFTTLDFFNAGDVRLIVLTPEITSLQNAYAFLKMAIYRRLQRIVAGRSIADKLAESFGGRAFEIGSNMTHMSTFLSLVDSEAPELSAPFRLLLGEYHVGLVGNMLAKPDDRNVVHAIQRMNKQFLGLDTEVLACFRTNPKVRASVNAGRPFVLQAAGDYDVAEFARLAKRLLGVDLRGMRQLRAQIVDALTRSGAPTVFGFDGVEVRAETASPAAAPRAPTVPASPPPAPVAAARASAPEAAPAPAGAAAASNEWTQQLNRVRRTGPRTNSPTYVELNLGGHWHLGSIIGLSDTGAFLTGIRTGAEWLQSETALRLVDMSGAHHDDDDDLAVAVRLSDYDAASGRLALEFCDPHAARPMIERCQPRG